MRCAPVTTLHLLRHGQASHNVRAEPLRAAGCTFAAFLEQMRLDDELDAKLTERGERDARELGRRLREEGVSETRDWYRDL